MATYKTEQELADLVKTAIGRKGTQKAWAAKIGVSAQYLSDFLNGNRGVPAAVLEALGYEPTRFYRKAEK